MPQWQVRLHVAAGMLPLGQRDVGEGEGLVGDLAEQVAEMLIARPRFLSSVCAMYQGAHAVSVAANMASLARE